MTYSQIRIQNFGKNDVIFALSFFTCVKVS